MTDIRAVVSNAKNLGKFCRSVLEVVDYLDETGNIEQQRRDAEAAAKTARENTMDAGAGQKTAKATLNNIWETVEEAKEEAKRLVGEAGAKAEEIRAAAQAHAAGVAAASREATDRSKEKIVGSERKAALAWDDHVERMKAADADYASSSEAVGTIKAELVELREKIGA